MKRLSFFIVLCVALSLTACGKGAAQPASSAKAETASSMVEAASASSSVKTESEPSASSGEAASAADANVMEKEFGTFTVPQGWGEAEELSEKDYFFYLQEGTDLAKPTSNISVNLATNKYSKDDYGNFAKAIQAQIAKQVGPDVTFVGGSGTSTKNGIPLIIMDIETENMLTVQYYIVGDYEFVMVQMSDFYDEDIPDVQEVAREIVDSFVWAE